MEEKKKIANNKPHHHPIKKECDNTSNNNNTMKIGFCPLGGVDMPPKRHGNLPCTYACPTCANHFLFFIYMLYLLKY
jgi:hypothetical protein